MGKPTAVEEFDTTDSKQIKDAKQTEKLEEDLETEDIRFLLNTKQGRRFIWRLFDDSAIFGGMLMNTNSNMTAFNVGVNHRAKQLFEKIHVVDPEMVYQMLRERNE